MRRCLLLMTLLGSLSVFAAQRDDAWVRKESKRVRASDPSSWRKIPWTASLPAARKASKAEDCPVFLFTLEGNMDTGRC